MIKGAILMLGAAMLIPLGDAVAKYAHLHFDAPIEFMAWSRFALGALMMAPIALARGVRGTDMLHWPLALRGVIIGLAVWFILQGAAREPLANVYGAFFVAPVLSFVLAVLWLKERPRPARWLLTLIGFCGVLLVVRPTVSLSSGMAMALLAGVFYGLFLTVNRWMAGQFRPEAMLWMQLIVAALILTPFGIDPQSAVFGPPLILCVLASAAISASANLMLLLAYGYAAATRLAPLVYVQLIAATLWGLTFFGAVPDVIALAGIALLLGSGLAALLLAPDK